MRWKKLNLNKHLLVSKGNINNGTTCNILLESVNFLNEK